MIAALTGRRNRDKFVAKRNFLQAYHIGAFTGAAFNGKLKPFDQYNREGDQPKLNAFAATHHFFRSLQARGTPVTIERVERV